MPKNGEIGAAITGLGYCLPENSISSREISLRVTAESGDFQIPAGLIERLSGVAQRYHAAQECCSSDLAACAGIRALRNAHVEPAQVDIMIFAAASQDIAEPATANIVQEKIGCSNAHVFDVKNACNSFLNALDIAHAFIATERARRVLITTGEILSPIINWRVKDLKDLYLKLAGFTLGDGGGACVIEAANSSGGLLPGRFFSEGCQWRLSTVLSGGTFMRDDMSRLYFESDSAALQSVALRYIPGLLLSVVDELGWNLQRDVKLVVPHQVSLRLLQALCKVTKFPLNRCMVTLNRFGNTAAASIPIALSIAVEEGRIGRGDKLLLVGGAAGFSAAVIPIVW
ncbi:MAG: 3-oxoacyl-ACP synthase III family protein [Ktedonobacteraceae bacterium]